MNLQPMCPGDLFHLLCHLAILDYEDVCLKKGLSLSRRAAGNCQGCEIKWIMVKHGQHSELLLKRVHELFKWI